MQAQVVTGDIDPFIGTGGHGHSHPSASMPFGMVQLGPDSRQEGWDGCSGYHYSDSTLYGFSHTHLSGTGVADYNDIQFRPHLMGEDLSQPSPFIKSSESSAAGFYAVTLSNGIQVSLTASERMGLQKIQFPKGQRALVQLDLSYRDRTLAQGFEANASDLRGSTTFQGHRISEGWALEQHVYFAGKTSHPFNHRITGDGLYVLDFGFIGEDALMIEVALSSVSESGAQRNWQAESQAFDFQGTLSACQDAWQLELDRLQVYGGDKESKRIYATALYHAFLVPNLWSDRDGSYRGMDGVIHQDRLHPHYTVFSLWDTYRTAHPLYALVQPKRTEDFLVTMLDQFKQSGRLPVWELAGNETDCMIGYHSVSVIADALAKGYAVDTAATIQAMMVTADGDSRGLDDYHNNGYLSMQDESESVSKSLEYAYDDACIAMALERFQEDSLAVIYHRRSQAWISLLDPETGLMRPRDNGQFMQRYDPREVNNHFTEANSWQYSFAPVHALSRWQALLVKDGHSLDKQLDALFSAPSSTLGRTQVDITGLIGQYAHGNEPSHHIAYLYNCTDSPWKGQEKVAEILETMYSDQPFGYQGNEDCGQMSAWYVMASIGLYPLVPGEAQYATGAPLWDSVRIAHALGETTLASQGDGIYYHGYENANDPGLTWSGSMSHQYLTETKRINIQRADFPQSGRPWHAYLNQSHRYNKSHNNLIPAPIIQVQRQFKDSSLVHIVYQDGKEETFAVHSSGHLSAGTSHVSHADYSIKPNNWSAEILSGTLSDQYNLGPGSLIDGIHGEIDWRKGHWNGLQGEDLIIELLPSKGDKFSAITVDLSLLKEIKSWIALPSQVTAVAHFRLGQQALTSIVFNDVLTEGEPRIETASWSIESRWWNPLQSITITLKNPGLLEQWHPGAGSDSYIFIDEITLTHSP